MSGTPELVHPDLGDVALTDVLFALSDPARLQIVRDLVDGPLEMAHCGAANPSLPKSTKSHLMKVLREAGLIRNEPHGRQRLVSLRRDEVDAVFPGLLDSVLGRRQDGPSSGRSSATRGTMSATESTTRVGW